MPAQSRSSSNRPSFDDLVKAYPSPLDWGPGDVKRLIGGAANDTKAPPDQQWLGGESGDTCTLRMSRAFNRSSVHIPAHFHGLRTVKGSDGFNYAFAVQELHGWLKQQFGPPDILVKGKPVKREPFLGKKGIMVFDIVFGMNPGGRTRALGHADLWDGATFFDEISGQSSQLRDFFSIADAVSLWILKGSATLQGQ